MMDRQPEEEGGDRRSVPERLGGHLYYTRRDEGKGFPVYVRRPVGGALDDEQVVGLDACVYSVGICSIELRRGEGRCACCSALSLTSAKWRP